MARLLSDDSEKDRGARFGAKALMILGIEYKNSAAKFWSGLIDEVANDVPQCDAVVLTSTGTSLLSRDLLFPQHSLQRDFDRLAERDLEEVIREVAEELELFGGPSAVGISLLQAGEEIKSQQLPPSCIDGDIFVYLLVWLLEWSGVPQWNWNGEFNVGDVVAEDYQRGMNYRMVIAIRNQHVNEGVYQRSVTMQFERELAE